MNAFRLIQSDIAQYFNRSARLGWVGCLTLWMVIGGWSNGATRGTLALAQSLGEAPQATLAALLLKNDRVLLGKIERQGDAFLVRIADDSQVSIPKAQTQFLGRHIQDLYIYKRQSLTNPTTGDHFKLTRWCMANQLLDQAVNHYQIVAKDAGSHPRVKQLAVELRNQLLEVEDFRSYLGLPPIVQRAAVLQSPAAAPPTSPSIVAQAAAASGGRHVVAASHKLESPPHPLVVQRFADRVQPLLISRCSQAACHGGQAENRLRLINPNSKFFAQTSADNLASVLPFAQPLARDVIPLLAYATQAHGLQRQPGIAITEASGVAELQAWVELVHNPVVTAVAAAPSSGLRPVPGGLLPVDRDAGQLKQVPRGEALPAGGNALSGKPASGNIQFPPGHEPPSLGELDALERQFDRLRPATPGTSDLPAASSSRDPFDPFDPAEFNRRVSRPAGDR